MGSSVSLLTHVDDTKNEDQILAKKIKEALGEDCHDNPLDIRNKVLFDVISCKLCVTSDWMRYVISGLVRDQRSRGEGRKGET